MTERTRASDLPVDRIERMLAPLGAAARDLTIAVEGPDGSTLVESAPSAPGGTVEATLPGGPTGPRVTRELRSGGALLGRLVASTRSGPDGSGAAEAFIESIAISIEELVDQARVVAAGDGPSGSTDPATLAADLALSRLQQRMIVSLQAPEVVGFEMASHYEPAREVGGDFFELFRLRRRGHPLGVVIADVAGKGIAAALLMAFARPVIHTALTAASGPAEALERVNRILVDELHTGLFITVIAARLDVRSGMVRIANAGHEFPMLVPGDGGPIRPIVGGGPLMGAFPRLALSDTELELAPGDQLVLYTDGVTDTRATSGERFGRERMLASIERSRGASAFEVVAALRDDLRDFCVEAQPADDVTIVVVGRGRGGG